MTRVAVVLGLLCAGGCDLLATGGDVDDEGGGEAFDPAPDIANTGNDVDAEAAEDRVCECPPDDAGIYLLTEDGEIWTYDPRTGCFEFVMQVRCGGMTDFFSLAVSRHGRVWIQFGDRADLYTVDLEDPEGACLDPGFDSDALLCAANLAFVREGADDACDRMYLYSAPKESDHGEFSVMDPRTLELSYFPVDADSTYGDLTGTPDGRLFGLVRDPGGPRVREYDKHTGEVLSEVRVPELDELWTGSLSYWGGYFYIYAQTEETGGTRMLLEYDRQDLRGQGRVVSEVVGHLPFHVLSTAVSPCAPAIAGPPRAVTPGCTKF